LPTAGLTGMRLPSPAPLAEGQRVPFSANTWRASRSKARHAVVDRLALELAAVVDVYREVWPALHHRTLVQLAQS
jgi:hypothetical protein